MNTEGFLFFFRGSGFLLDLGLLDVEVFWLLLDVLVLDVSLGPI